MTERPGGAGDDEPGDRPDELEWFDTRFGAPEQPVASDAAEESASSEPGALLVDDDPRPHAEGDDHDVSEDAASSTRTANSVVERIVQPFRSWWNAPWDDARSWRLVATVAALSVSTLVIMLVVHFNPIPVLGSEGDLIFDDTTPTGGDMGAHVWAPAFLRDYLLPNFQLSGWTMDWYGGLPLYRFYMVIPALAIVALDAIPFVSYGVAFKLVAISGLVTFPAACWGFGRLAAFRHPIPELFAFGGLCFLLDESFEIYGGNVKSTMAGEYSFSIALTLCVLGLGLLAHGLRTGRYRVWAAVLLSLAAVSHGIVLIFTAFAALVLCVTWCIAEYDLKRIFYVVTTGVTTLLLMAWWVGPFLLGHEFMTDMKYGFRPNGPTDSFWDMFFPLTTALDITVSALAVVGFVGFLMRRQLTGVSIGVTCLLFSLGVFVTRGSIPGLGLLWNPRLLPFVYLTRYLLMVAGAYELLSWALNAWRRQVTGSALKPSDAFGSFTVVSVSILLVFGWMYEVLPLDGRATVTNSEGEAASVYSWGPLRKGAESGRAVADGWTRYNWQGYEGRPAYPAYYDLVSTMEGIGADRGCGRAVWENNSANGEYGTTMSLMLLPHWTDGCIGSMEGLFFEATASTNYHFITAAAVSESSSNPVRQLRYTNNDAQLGVRHMRDLGVRYLMVRTDAAKAEAATADGLEFVALSGTWEIYQVADSNIVEALDLEPVVVTPSQNDDWYKPGDDRERHLELGTSWFQNRETWPAVPVDEGPASWQRLTASIVADERVEPFDDQRRRVDYVEPEGVFDPTSLPAVTVSDVDMRQQSIAFSVDQVGVPVLVKVSYFPNWQVSGAEGPFRAGANHMIVVPTSTEVELTYDARAGVDWFFYALTALGIALCVFWRRRGDEALGMSDRRSVPATGIEAADDEVADPDNAGVERPVVWSGVAPAAAPTPSSASVDATEPLDAPWTPDRS